MQTHLKIRDEALGFKRFTSLIATLLPSFQIASRSNVSTRTLAIALFNRFPWPKITIGNAKCWLEDGKIWV